MSRHPVITITCIRQYKYKAVTMQILPHCYCFVFTRYFIEYLYGAWNFKYTENLLKILSGKEQRYQTLLSRKPLMHADFPFRHAAVP